MNMTCKIRLSQSLNESRRGFVERSRSDPKHLASYIVGVTAEINYQGLKPHQRDEAENDSQLNWRNWHCHQSATWSKWAKNRLR